MSGEPRREATAATPAKAPVEWPRQWRDPFQAGFQFASGAAVAVLLTAAAFQILTRLFS
jgi:hypothetical protein